jgi:hypothetical protein
MVVSRIVSSGIPYKKRWIRFSYGSDLSLQQYTESIPFTAKEQKYVKVFLKKMDDYSERSAKLRRLKKAGQLRKVDRQAGNALLRTGRRIFRILARVREVKVSTFEDLFGEAFELTLILDANTRKFPWELAYDGQDFLCTRYDVGRKIENPNVQRLSGYGPEHRTALVVGINYKWHSPEKRLDTPEREALLVKRQLEKKRYHVILLRGRDATISEVKGVLSKGVSIFHFTGHGIYRTRQPEGRRGCLILNAEYAKPRDAYLTEEDLKTCFDKARGAPYLSFLNACESAKEVYSSHLVDAFVEFGAEYVIGTYWPICDSPSIKFSSRFYKEVAKDTHIAEALKLVRRQFSHEKTLKEAVTWPSFVLYGSPRHPLPKAP